MKQIVFLSGKGGTGKTTISSNLFYILNNSVLADCDVESPDLQCFFQPEIISENKVDASIISAKINEDCIGCKKCIEVCRFDALEYNKKTNKVEVLDYFCTGCEMCTYVCPQDAIYTKTKESSKIILSKTNYGNLVFSEYNPGDKGTGKIVSMIRKFSENKAIEQNSEYILLDGAPGIGCPVIASIMGCDKIILVTEPTNAAISDLERIFLLLNYFNIETGIIINKSGINHELNNKIKNIAENMDINIITEIPYNDKFNEYLNNRNFLCDLPEFKQYFLDIKNFILK